MRDPLRVSRENTLHNYRFSREKDPEQIVFIQAVRKGREASIDVPLFEGNIGQMMLCPVKPHGSYRGMVYYVRVK